MKERTRKFLTAGFVLLLSSFIGVIPLFGVEKVNATENGSWTTLAPLPTPISSYKDTVALNGTIYYIDGDMTLRYDPETNNWTQLTPLPTRNPGCVIAVCQNKIYVLGGSPDVPTQVYNPATGTWENRTSFHETRGIVHANVVDGKIYVMGGQYLGFIGMLYPVSSNYVYDPETDTWSEMAPLPVGVGGYASAVVDDKIYIISGGYGAVPDWEPTNLVQIFDPATNQWTNGTSIPTPVYNAKACAITEPSGSKRIHVIGGQLNYYWYDIPFDGVDLHQVYDPETDTWTNATALPTPRTGLGLAAINDEIYVIGGSDGDTYLTVNEKYTPAGYIPEFPSWTILPLLITASLVALLCKKRLNKNLSNQQTPSY